MILEATLSLLLTDVQEVRWRHHHHERACKPVMLTVTNPPMEPLTFELRWRGETDPPGGLYGRMAVPRSSP